MARTDLSQREFNKAADTAYRDEQYLVDEAVSEVLREPARPDYSLKAVMTVGA